MLAGAAVTLLVGAWVASAGPVALFRRQNLSGFSERKAPGSDFEEWSNVPPPPKKIYTSADANETVVAIIVWGLKLAIAAIVALVLFMVIRDLWRRRPASVPDQATDAAPIDTLPEVLLEGAGARMEELETGTPTNAVVACWVRLEEEVAAAGLTEDRSRTSSEVVARVLGHYDVDADALAELAALYREARFSDHALTEAHRARARDALTTVHVDLRRAATKEALRA
ncbi:protein of unknown function [Pedococcus cremeus]|uniref:Protein-glutamine gamma-glutamyltransferase-like C-terminal domain-containing protein n=2 Tax=Pedococcus cremeus TaxID=587636 RepID=A0A1H9US64_9MICO|nr:protein of unknown function [Pedococcus cremeus]